MTLDLGDVTAGCLLGGACTVGYGDCDNNPATGCEADLFSLANCGACGAACGPLSNASSECHLGTCRIVTCTAGYGDCDTKGGGDTQPLAPVKV